MRKIKSFVCRGGKLSKAQKYALKYLCQDYCLNLSQLNNVHQHFDKQQQLIIEIGFGNGDSLLKMAFANPQFNYLGVEVYRAGIGSLLNKTTKLGLTNLKIIEADAIDVLNKLADGQISGVQIFFPDPWHKKKHHKRRLIKPNFLDLLSVKLKSQGLLYIATDWQDYAEEIATMLKNHPYFSNITNNQKQRPTTKFELQAKQLGHNIWDLMFIHCC